MVKSIEERYPDQKPWIRNIRMGSTCQTLLVVDIPEDGGG